MTSSIPHPVPGSLPDAAQHIEGRLREIADLARECVSTQEFLRAWLERVVDALAAVEGVVWSVSPPVEAWAEYYREREAVWIGTDAARKSGHAALVQHSLTRGEARLIPPLGAPGTDFDSENLSDYLLIHCPLWADGRCCGLLEIVQRASSSLSAQEGYLRFVTTAATYATEFLERGSEQPGNSGETATEGTPAAPVASGGLREEFSTSPTAEFLYQLHESLALETTADAIANDGRLQFGCDRVTVVALRGIRSRVLAISGVERPDPRANIVRAAEQLASAVARVNEPVWYAEDPEELPPQISGPLEDFLEESTARVVGAVPLCVRHGDIHPPPVGVMILECFDRKDVSQLRRLAEGAETQCAIALRNALRYESVAWLRCLAPWVQREPNGFAGKRRRWLIAGGLVSLFAALLGFVRTELTVSARGELQPRDRRDVFAPSDGIVAQVLVAHEERVKQGQPLVVLRDSALELEFRRVTGAMETARKKLSSIQALRLDQRDSSRGDPVGRPGRISGEEEEIKEELQSLREQQAVLERRQDDLTLRSPLDGRVLTWNVADVLNSRPVRRGQVLLTVARLEGPWELQLEIPEDRAGHVLAARRESAAALDVTYILSNQPATTYAETLSSVALATEIDEIEGPYLPATVVLPAERVPRSRPGTTVSARIACGRHALGYVWLHDIYDSLVARLWY